MQPLDDTVNENIEDKVPSSILFSNSQLKWMTGHNIKLFNGLSQYRGAVEDYIG